MNFDITKDKKLFELWKKLEYDVKYNSNIFNVKYYKYSERAGDDVWLVPGVIEWEDKNIKNILQDYAVESIGVSDEAFYYIEFVFREVNENYDHWDSNNFYKNADINIIIEKLTSLKNELYNKKTFNKKIYYNKIFRLGKESLKKRCKEFEYIRLLIIDMINHIIDFLKYHYSKKNCLTVVGP